MDGEELVHDPVRMILRARGYRFCDDQRAANTSEFRELTRRSRDEAEVLEELLEEGLVASSTDHETQGIGNTLDSTHEFWSSRGSGTPEASETLIFRLRYPACVVRYVELSVYRCVMDGNDACGGFLRRKLWARGQVGWRILGNLGPLY